MKEKNGFEANVLEAGIGRHLLFSDKDAAALLGKLCTAETTSAFQALRTVIGGEAVVELRRHRMPIRQVARLSGLSKGIVERLDRKNKQDR
jgi:hypothetical protein